MGLNKPSNISGVAVHNELTGRNDADGHPIGAITGLQTDLNNKATAITGAVNTANTADGKATTALSTAQTADSNATTALGRIGTLGSLNTTAKGNLVEAINENFTNANNGKVVIASAVNGKGGTANDSMTFSQLADAVTAIPTPAEPEGTAVSGDVLSGKTFSNDIGVGIAGTMLDRANANINALLTSDVTIPQGYYDGTGKVIAPQISAGNFIYYTGENGSANSSSPLYKVREATVNMAGTYRTNFMLRTSASPYTAQGRIYVNGVARGILRENSTTSNVNFMEDITGLVPGDKIQLYVRIINSSYTMYYENFTIGGNLAIVQ